MNKDDENNKPLHEELPFGKEEGLPDISIYSEKPENHPTRERVALDTLARYSGTEPEQFQKYILLTNFPHYVDRFADIMDAEVTIGSVLKVAHCKEQDISIIDYRVGSPMAALIMDVISYVEPQCAVMLGLCGGLHHTQSVGDLLLPMAAIRDEGASLHYMPTQVPSLPAFMVQQLISEELMDQDIPFRTGVLHTTDYRMWEFDEDFKKRLRTEKASAIDMECSALFTTGFCRKVPVGALMLISDLPLQPAGIKTKESAQAIFREYTDKHLQLGIDSLLRMKNVVKEKKINFRRFHF